LPKPPACFFAFAKSRLWPSCKTSVRAVRRSGNGHKDGVFSPPVAYCVPLSPSRSGFYTPPRRIRLLAPSSLRAPARAPSGEAAWGGVGASGCVCVGVSRPSNTTGASGHFNPAFAARRIPPPQPRFFFFFLLSFILFLFAFLFFLF